SKKVPSPEAIHPAPESGQQLAQLDPEYKTQVAEWVKRVDTPEGRAAMKAQEGLTDEQVEKVIALGHSIAGTGVSPEGAAASSAAAVSGDRPALPAHPSNAHTSLNGQQPEDLPALPPRGVGMEHWPSRATPDGLHLYAGPNGEFVAVDDTGKPVSLGIGDFSANKVQVDVAPKFGDESSVLQDGPSHWSITDGKTSWT